MAMLGLLRVSKRLVVAGRRWHVPDVRELHEPCDISLALKGAPLLEWAHQKSANYTGTFLVF
jgi:hypothetical protein